MNPRFTVRHRSSTLLFLLIALSLETTAAWSKPPKPELPSGMTGSCFVPPDDESDYYCGPQEADPLFPSSAAPPPGTVYFDLVYPEQVHSGSPFSVSALTSRLRQPLGGVSVTLLDLDSMIVASAVTDPSGTAILYAPFVSTPGGYVLEATAPGAANFIPQQDNRAYEAYDATTGVYPTNHLTVTCILQDPPPATRKFYIDEGMGWATAVSLDDLIKKAGTGGFDADEDWWARRTDVEDHLKELGSSDVYIFFGHGGDTDGVTTTAEGIIGWSKFMWARGGRFKSGASMAGDAGADGNPPGIVFLATCSSHSLTQALVDTCVKLAVGFTDVTPLGTIAGATKVFWNAMLDGKTLAEATEATNDYLKAKDGGLFNPNSSRLAWKGKAWMAGAMTLNQILDHARRPFQVDLKPGDPETAPGKPFLIQSTVGPHPAIYALIPNAEAASILIYDISGRLVRRLEEDITSPGEYTIVWDGQDDGGRSVTTGVYFARLVTGSLSTSARVLLVR